MDDDAVEQPGEQAGDEEPAAGSDDLLEAQQGKGYGTDTGEREDALPE